MCASNITAAILGTGTTRSDLQCTPLKHPGRLERGLFAEIYTRSDALARIGERGIPVSNRGIAATDRIAGLHLVPGDVALDLARKKSRVST